MGPNNIVMTWARQPQAVHRSRRTQWNAWKGDLTLARIDGGVPEVLPPLPGRVVLVFAGRQTARPTTARVPRIPHLEALSRGPGGRNLGLRFRDEVHRETDRGSGPGHLPDVARRPHLLVSERDANRQANLYVMDLPTKQIRALTQFTEFAVKSALGDQAIVREWRFHLHRLDLASEQVAKVPIEIREDFEARPRGMARCRPVHHRL